LTTTYSKEARLRVVDAFFRTRDDAALIEALSEIPGGADLLAWFGRAQTWEISDKVDKPVTLYFPGMWWRRLSLEV
jgi:hypothetical protein